jgi:hypothetical protein
MAQPVRRGEQLTLADSVDRLTKAGYADWFKAEDGGLRSATNGCVHSPDEMRVDEFLRFEGETNPDDEAIVFALTCVPHGVKGTYTIPYGTTTPQADAEIVRHLQSKQRK